MLSRVLQTCLLAPSEVTIRLPAAWRAGTDGWRLSVIDRPLFHYALSVYERRWSGSRQQPVDLWLTVHLPLIVFVRGRNLNQHVTAALLLLIQITNESVRYERLFLCQGVNLVRQSLLSASHSACTLHLEIISNVSLFYHSFLHYTV